MFGSSIIDIAMGLVFVYVLISLTCTAANELLASAVAWRARNLAEGLRNLLNGPDSAKRGPGLKTDAGGGAGTLAQELFDHPLMQGLYRRNRPPSYIPSRTFALVLLDIVFRKQGQRPTTIEGIRKAVTDSHVSDHMKRVLYLLIDDTAIAVETGLKLKENGVLDAGKLETAAIQLQQKVEVWFNDSMERVSGWYKRKVQALTFVVAAVLTIALNVDSVAIVKALSADSTLRESIVAQAEKLAEQPPAYVILPASGQTAPTAAPQDPAAATDAAFVRLQEHIATLKDSALPIGWTEATAIPRTGRDWLLKVLGLLLTMGAASLGAPFWFDVLNKIVTIRSVGKAPEETPKAPKEIPRPASPTAEPARS
jgi:hypothetical protein